MILLDALGTLVGLEPPWRPFAELMAERHGVQVPLAESVRVLEAEMGFYREHCGHAGDEASLAVLRAECAALLSRELGTEVDPQTLLDSLRFRAYPEVAAALAALRARGERLVVLSNWDVSLHDVLARCGLGELVDRVLTSAELGAAKPAAEIFRAALDGSDPASAVHVGDSLVEDVQGAAACGIEPVLLAREADGRLLAPGAVPGSPPPGVRVIAGLDEL